jgi:hypothetical protein
MDLNENFQFLRFPRLLFRTSFLTTDSATVAEVQALAVWLAAISWIECRT